MIGQFSLYQCKGMSGTAACLLLSGFEIVLKKIGHKPSVGQIVTGNKRFYNALLLDKFKQLDSSQYTKLYPDTYSLQILSLNLSFAIIER